MYGYLVPSSGGQAVPLRKTRLFLGRVKGSEAPLSRENAYCQLELIEGFWNVEDLQTPGGVKINGRACKRERLMPEDEITIGKHRYRISFQAPKYAGVGKLAKSSGRTHRRDAPPRHEPSRPRSSAPAGGALGRLVPIGGGPEIPLLRSDVKIGRKPPCDIVLGYRSISGVHCRLELRDGYWHVEDLDSRNGIRVDGVSVTKAWVLPNARLSIAEHRFRLDYVGRGNPPAEAVTETNSITADIKSRSLIDKLGLTEQDLQRTEAEADSDAKTQRRKWNLMDND